MVIIKIQTDLASFRMQTTLFFYKNIIIGHHAEIFLILSCLLAMKCSFKRLFKRYLHFFTFRQKSQNTYSLQWFMKLNYNLYTLLQLKKYILLIFSLFLSYLKEVLINTNTKNIVIRNAQAGLYSQIYLNFGVNLSLNVLMNMFF